MAKEAIVLLNMGGPNNLDEVEMFLKNMFADKNILTMKSDLLRSFVGTMITFTRTESSQDIYKQIGGKSPIVGHTKKLVAKLQQRVGDSVIVDFGEPEDATGMAGDGRVVSLGDGGVAILTFDTPLSDGPGPDFAVFENAFLETFLELAFVEVSSDDVNYFRFPWFFNNEIKKPCTQKHYAKKHNASKC